MIASYIFPAQKLKMLYVSPRKRIKFIYSFKNNKKMENREIARNFKAHFYVYELVTHTYYDRA